MPFVNFLGDEWGCKEALDSGDSSEIVFFPEVVPVL